MRSWAVAGPEGLISESVSLLARRAGGKIVRFGEHLATKRLVPAVCAPRCSGSAPLITLSP